MNNSVFLLALLVATACTTSKSLDRQSQIKLEQYKVQGMELYTKHCSACHQDSGEGLATLYPPLKGSDYLLDDIPRAACIIQNGLVETIKVNGKTYSQMMPGIPQLTSLEVAEILTYVSNSWGNDYGLVDVKSIEYWLENCN